MAQKTNVFSWRVAGLGNHIFRRSRPTALHFSEKGRLILASSQKMWTTSANSMTLVDTSAWIDFFKGGKSLYAQALDDLLENKEAALCGPVYSELLSGAADSAKFTDLKKSLDALPCLEPPEDIWLRVAQHRFRLAKKGYPCSVVDLFIAVTAHHHQRSLLTLDRDFDLISREVGTLLCIPKEIREKN